MIVPDWRALMFRLVPTVRWALMDCPIMKSDNMTMLERPRQNQPSYLPADDQAEGANEEPSRGIWWREQ